MERRGCAEAQAHGSSQGAGGTCNWHQEKPRAFRGRGIKSDPCESPVLLNAYSVPSYIGGGMACLR